MNIIQMREEHLAEAAILEKQNFSTPWTENDFRQELLHPETCAYFVAIEDGRVVGTCGAVISQDEAEILNVSVDKCYLRRRIAENLLKATMDECIKRGVTMFTLEVRINNKPARCLYEKLGFEYMGVRPGLYTEPKEDAAIYNKWTS